MLKKENLHSMYGILTYIDPFFNHPNVCVYGSPRRVVSGYIYIYIIYTPTPTKPLDLEAGIKTRPWCPHASS